MSQDWGIWRQLTYSPIQTTYDVSVLKLTDESKLVIYLREKVPEKIFRNI